MECDIAAVFCRKRKVRPSNTLENNLKCQEVLGRINLQERMKEDVFKLKFIYMLHTVEKHYRPTCLKRASYLGSSKS